MNRGIYIQADEKQLIGAKVAKHALETTGGARKANIPVTIMQVEMMPEYMAYAGMEYKRGGETRTHNPADLQFFTLSRFMPPSLMGYEGRALVIDPDIFALTDITSLFDMKFEHASILACPKKDAWDSSVMLLDCAQLTHWDITRILEGLKNGSENYRDWSQLKKEKVTALSRDWNSLDHLDENTKMLHTTNRLTQPWKTELPIDFHINIPPKLFGIIPRFWVSMPTRYAPHPDKNIEKLFFSLLADALRDGAVTQAELNAAIERGAVRPDACDMMPK